MAKGTIQQTIAIDITGLDDVKAIDKQIAALEKKKAKITLDADTGDSAKKLDKIDDQLAQLAKRKAELQVTADTTAAVKGIDDVLAKVDRLGGEPGKILLSSNASQIVNDIADLITDIDRLDASDPEVTVKVDQIHALESDLERLSAKAKELGDTPITLDTSHARQGLDDIGKSAGSSKSVLANMVGNSTQDLGALGGVAGSAGVAIGQMGEYMVDAANDGDKLGQLLTNFGKVAGPIALLSLAVKSLSDVTSRFGDSSERTAKSVDVFSDALRDGTSTTDAYKSSVKEMDGVILDTVRNQSALVNTVAEIDSHWYSTGIGVHLLADALGITDDETKNITPTLNKAGIKLDEFAKASTEGADAYENMRLALKKTTLTADEQNEILTKLANNQTDNAVAAHNHAEVQKFLGDEIVSQRDAILAATIAEKARLDAIKKTDAATKAADNTQMYIDQAAGLAGFTAKQDEATAAAKAFSDTLASTDFAATGIEGGISGMSAFHDQLFGLKDIASQTEASFDALGESLKENGNTFDLNTEKGRANQKAVEDLASAVDLQLAAAFDNADGSFDTFNASAQTIADTLRTKLIKEMGLSKTQADDMIRQLGLMPEDIETRYKLSGTEEAKAKIGLLQGSIEALPKDVQAKVTQQIIAGDYVGALATVNNYYANHPGTLPTSSKAPTTSDLAGTVGAANSYFSRNPATIPVVTKGGGIKSAGGTNSMPEPGGIAGEAGGEFVQLPNGQWGYVDKPTYMPPKTKVISVRRTRSILAGRSKGPTGPGLPTYANGTGAPAVLLPSTTVIHHTTNINAAVVGNRYDTAQAVGQANRDLRRLLGRRGTGMR